MNVSTTQAAFNHTAGDHRDYWTRWFNADNPAYGDGDDETVDSIQNIYGKICENGFQILSAKCRNEGNGDVFDKDSALGNRSDVLNLDCTSEGIICKNIAQGTRQCQDYSIQFLCHYQDDSSNNTATNCFTQFDFRVYIILTAVPLFLLLVRMWWVYVYRVGKQKRRRQQPTNDANPDIADSTSIASNLRKPPPSYKELFGETLTFDNSIFAISRENIIVCPVCETSRCCVSAVAGRNGGRGSTSISIETDSSSNEARTQIIHAGVDEESGDRITPEKNGTDVFIQIIPTVSFTNEYPNSVVSDVSPVDTDFSNVVLATQNEAHNYSVNICSPLNRQTPQVPTTTRQPNCSLLPNKNTQSNLDCLMNPSWLRPSTISHPCACLCHRTIPSQDPTGERWDNSNYAGRTESCESVISPSFPGRHIPVLDPSRVWVETRDSPPPSFDPEELPTYEDALILTEVKASEEEKTSL